MPLDSIVELERVVVAMLIRQQFLRAGEEFVVRERLRLGTRRGACLWLGLRRRGCPAASARPAIANVAIRINSGERLEIVIVSLDGILATGRWLQSFIVAVSPR